ncbi:uncharacterized protein ISCGN_009333 [Ixodes scapularis]
MKCLVHGCTRTHRDAGVSFHRLPGKDPLRSRWLEALRLRANSKLLHQLDRVCSEHFSAQSFTSWEVSKNLGFERKKERLDDPSTGSHTSTSVQKAQTGLAGLTQFGWQLATYLNLGNCTTRVRVIPALHFFYAGTIRKGELPPK